MEKRIKSIQEILSSDEAVIITSDVNRLYLSGFKSSAGIVLITKSNALLLIDFRYFEKAKAEVKHLDVMLAKGLYSQVNEILREQNIRNIYIETDCVTVDGITALRNALGNINISEDDKITKKITQMRSIKDEREIESIKRAQALTDKAFSYILDYIKPNVTEREIALKMEFFMRREGSEGAAFDFIVVSGKNSSLPHGVPTDKKIQKGDFVTMDFGGICDGYCSDMTRTVVVGEVSQKQRKIYDIVLQAHRAALSVIRPNAKCIEVDKAARDLISNNGYGDFFGHGLGHSVGLEIHEAPACNTRDETPLREGMIMTVEPGIYLPNEFGVRIEDMVLVTKNGYLNLTKSPKELIVL